MREFEREFRDNPNPRLNWPGNTPEKMIAREFAMIAQVLFEAVRINRQASAAKVTVANAALHARLVKFLDRYRNPTRDEMEGWPASDATVKRAGRKDVAHQVIRLWEAAVALQVLLGSYALATKPGDGGGGTPRFPPH